MSRISFQLASVALYLLQSGKADRGKLQPGTIGTAADTTSSSSVRHGNFASSNLTAAAALQVGAQGRATLHHEATHARGRRRKDDEGTTAMKVEKDQRTAISSDEEKVSDEKVSLDGASSSMKYSDLVQLSLLLEEQHKTMTKELDALKAKVDEQKAKVDEHGEQVAFVKRLVQGSQKTASPKVSESHPGAEGLLELEDDNRQQTDDKEQHTDDQNKAKPEGDISVLGLEAKKDNLELLSAASRRKVHNEILLSDRRGKALLAVTDALRIKYYSAALKMEIPLQDVPNPQNMFDNEHFRLGYGHFASPIFSSLSAEEFHILKGFFHLHLKESHQLALGAVELHDVFKFAGIHVNDLRGSATTLNRLIMECVGTIHVIPPTTDVAVGLGGDLMKITFPEFVRCVLPDLMLLHMRV